ncbi:MAG: sigma-70 family RNA polymerase sigma factor [Polyangiales bacterium]|nr:sigma-70 family RNA polymerase sigma factor [Myxococcales bacterium]MCB9657681.1 sigma-70 family RNA polymerase sigma factor [Sandaracinaceae bacterium]
MPTPLGDDDRALLEAWRAGDAQAGEALFNRHFDAIYDFFASKLSIDVSDLVQRTFLGCVEARDRFRGDASFRTFLYAIARHELYGYFRSRKRNEALDFSVSSLSDLAPGPSSLLRAGTERARLVEALRTLPLDLQIILELRFWEDLSGPELAIVLEIPEGTVRSRLRRGVEALREQLARGTGSPTGVAQAAAELEAWSSALRGEATGDDEQASDGGTEDATKDDGQARGGDAAR